MDTGASDAKAQRLLQNLAKSGASIDEKIQVTVELVQLNRVRHLEVAEAIGKISADLDALKSSVEKDSESIKVLDADTIKKLAIIANGDDFLDYQPISKQVLQVKQQINMQSDYIKRISYIGATGFFIMLVLQVWSLIT